MKSQEENWLIICASGSLYQIRKHAPNQSSDQLSAGLIRAAGSGYLDAVRCLFEEFSADVSSVGSALLLVAMHNADQAMFRYFLERGADPNDEAGKPLRMAALHGQTDFLRQLIDAGGKPGWLDANLYIACAQRGQLAALKLIESLVGSFPPSVLQRAFIGAALNRHIEVTEYLLSNKAVDPEADSCIAMAKAVENDWPEMVHLLIRYQTSVDFILTKIIYGKTPDKNQTLEVRHYPMVTALHKGSEKVLDLLIKASAGIRFEDDFPLCFAAKSGQEKCLRILLKAGADPNARGGEPLRAAVAGGHYECVQALLRKGADPHLLQDEELRTCGDGIRALVDRYLKRQD